MKAKVKYISKKGRVNSFMDIFLFGISLQSITLEWMSRLECFSRTSIKHDLVPLA